MKKLKPVKRKRLSWDEFFMNMAILASNRTACLYHLAGAVIVDKYNRIISLGYNGPTEGDYHCNEIGCAKVDGNPITKKLERCRGAHAEINCIINAQDTRRLRDGKMYTALFPCYDCMKALNNIGIKELIYLKEYKRIQTGGEKKEDEKESWDLAKRRKIKIRKYKGKIYFDVESLK